MTNLISKLTERQLNLYETYLKGGVTKFIGEDGEMWTSKKNHLLVTENGKEIKFSGEEVEKVLTAYAHIKCDENTFACEIMSITERLGSLWVSVQQKYLTYAAY